MKNNAGFSLIEILISLGLGVVLSAGLIKLFVENKASYNQQQEIIHLQQSARIASLLVERDVRLAGYLGCANVISPPIMLSLNPPADGVITSDNSIVGYESVDEGQWLPALPAALSGRVKPNTDVIQIRRASHESATVDQPMANTDFPLTTNNTSLFTTGDTAILSDCASTDYFTVSSTTGNQIFHNASVNISEHLSKPYDANSRIAKLKEITYYIADSGRTNSNNQPIFSLFKLEENGAMTELVAGIEDMQIIYGVDSDNNQAVDTNLTADNISAANQWANIISTQITFLVASIEPASLKPLAYKFNNVSYTPSDLRLRRDWNSYIKIRNRGL